MKFGYALSYVVSWATHIFTCMCHTPAELEDCEKGSFSSEGGVPITKLTRAENGF